MLVRAFLAVAALLAGACGAEESPGSGAGEPADASTGPMIVTVEQEGYASGPLDGVLVLEDGCLLVEAAEGGVLLRVDVGSRDLVRRPPVGEFGVGG